MSRAEVVRRQLSAILVLACLCVSTAAGAQTARNVLVVVNRTSAVSLEIGSYYSLKRSVPASQILQIQTPAVEEITRAVYLAQIERPISEWLANNAAHDRILYIVLTKGVPLRVAGTTGVSGTVASVDSELTLVYKKMMAVPIPAAGSVLNPYFLGNKDVASLRPFSHKDHDLYLVTRLDGFSVADVKRLIDRAAAPTKQQGRILLKSRRDRGPGDGNTWLENASRRVNAQPGWANQAVLTDAFRAPADQPLLGYYSWGSNDPASAITSEPRLSFLPGALAAMYVSTDARTFQAPPETWRPGQSFAGSNQSLAGVLIREGATGVAGHVAEPFLTAAIRPDILFPAYARGLNLAEAFYAAMPLLGWQTVVVGDPLCAPFRRDSVAAVDLEPPADPVTGLPQFFSDRRVAVVASLGGTPEAGRYFIRGDQRLRRQDTAGAIAALETATKLAPEFDMAHLALASVYEVTGRIDAAIERYRKVVELKPDNVLALNNLAYALAARRNAPKEALPFAKRAYSLAPANPSIIDTFGWIHHLLGDNKTAEPLLLAAVKTSPRDPEILLHAATVVAANQNRMQAIELLDRARAINPALDSRDDVRRLRDLLRPGAQ